MRRISFILCMLFAWSLQLFAEPSLLKVSDVPKVLDRLFSFHIENRELSPLIIRRSMKLYIEQFDPEKMYLLESEVSNYLQLSDQKTREILQHLQGNDYSDYLALNALFQRAVRRAEAIRLGLAQELMNSDIQGPSVDLSLARYATSESELAERQRNRMIRHFLFHKARTDVDSNSRKAKVFSLYERRTRRSEASVLLTDSSGVDLSKEKGENIVATRILKSFAKSLDTHTSFFSAEEAYEMRLNLEKQFEGIGVVLSEGIDGVMIADLLKGSPAEQSGKIQLNDLLVEIDGQPVDKLPFEEVLGLLKRQGKEVILGFKRESSLFRVTLRKRAIVMQEERIQSSTETFGGGVIGKIALHSFYESSDGVSSERDLRAAINSFRQKGNLLGLVLDLRENSGGFLSQAVKVAGLFISNGVVVVSKYGHGEMHYLRSMAGRQFFNGPIVILTSQMSASAAEIVAQALQDYGVGLVVGDKRTFGKGSIQFQTVTDANADLFFKITVGRYYTVSGRSTQIDGVIADIVVPTQYAPYRIGERFLEYPLPPDAVDPVYEDPLVDLDANAQKVFQKRYLPFAQRVVPYWKRILPQLQDNSSLRIAENPQFQEFLRRVAKVRARRQLMAPNAIDELIRMGSEDLQMNESVNILKDMILIEAEQRLSEAASVKVQDPSRSR